MTDAQEVPQDGLDDLMLKIREAYAEQIQKGEFRMPPKAYFKAGFEKKADEQLEHLEKVLNLPPDDPRVSEFEKLNGMSLSQAKEQAAAMKQLTLRFRENLRQMKAE